MFKYEYTDLPKCPYCDHEEEDWWEWDLENQYDKTVGCTNCEKSFVVLMDLNPTFSSYKMEDEE